MRLDPTHLSAELLRVLGGGAVDAAKGDQARRAAETVRGEAEFEPLDRLLLKRLRALQVIDSAGSVGSFADAHALANRTAELMKSNTDIAGSLHADLARDRLRDLLSDQ